MKPKHYLNLKGASIIQTDALLGTDDLVKSVVKHNAIGVCIGNAGMGKTFCLSVTLARQPKLDYIWITLPTDATARLVSQKLVEALTGVPARKIERNELLRIKAQKLLMERRPLVIADEAQNLDRDGIEALRYLHDCCGCSFPIILAGGDGCWNVLSQELMLLSRVFDCVEHSPMTEKDLREILPTYHSVYSDVDPDVVKYVDDRYCRGEFRAWASFTIKVVDRLNNGNKVLDIKLAKKILRTFPKTVEPEIES